MLEAVLGRTYGPIEREISAAKVEEFVTATSDQPHRWKQHAPPAFAGALLFAVAPSFLADPEVAPHARMVIHGEQTFEWSAPLTVGATTRISGTLERVRERAGVGFANFALAVADSQGAPLITARSTFLLSGEAAPGGGASERSEPPPDRRAACEETMLAVDLPEAPLPVLRKSASRSDLVRYAAASLDFNPIHWDHASAVEAGLGGVVAHGLLAAAWAIQAGARLVDDPRPLRRARIRFRQPLYPAEPVEVAATRTGSSVAVTVNSGAVEHVVAQLELTDPKPR